MKATTTIPQLIDKNQKQLLAEWLDQQADGSGEEQRNLSQRFIAALKDGLQSGQLAEIGTEKWASTRAILEEVSQQGVIRGDTPTQTATFVFSLKQPLFNLLRRELGKDADKLAEEIWTATLILDKLGLYTTECLPEEPRGGDPAPAAGDARAFDARGEALGGHSGAAADRDPRQRAHPGGDGEPAAGDRDHRRRYRHHRHHRRADRRYAGRPASAEDGLRGPADGGGLHHQRHPAADRPDHRPSRRRARRGHQGDAGRRLCAGASPARARAWRRPA